MKTDLLSRRSQKYKKLHIEDRVKIVLSFTVPNTHAEFEILTEMVTLSLHEATALVGSQNILQRSLRKSLIEESAEHCTSKAIHSNK